MVGRNAELSVRMRAHRARLALTQQEVADGLARVAWVEEGRSVGVNADMVSKWERGDKRPSRFYLRLLCSLYQTTPEGLGERTNPSASQPIASDTLPVAATGMFVPPYVDFDASSTDMELILPKLLQLWRKESMQRRDLLKAIGVAPAAMGLDRIDARFSLLARPGTGRYQGSATMEKGERLISKLETAYHSHSPSTLLTPLHALID